MGSAVMVMDGCGMKLYERNTETKLNHEEDYGSEWSGVVVVLACFLACIGSFACVFGPEAWEVLLKSGDMIRKL